MVLTSVGSKLCPNFLRPGSLILCSSECNFPCRDHTAIKKTGTPLCLCHGSSVTQADLSSSPCLCTKWLPRQCCSCLLQPERNYLDFEQNSQLNYLWKAIYFNLGTVFSPPLLFFLIDLFFKRERRRNWQENKGDFSEEFLTWSHTATRWTKLHTAVPNLYKREQEILF